MGRRQDGRRLGRRQRRGFGRRHGRGLGRPHFRPRHRQRLARHRLLRFLPDRGTRLYLFQHVENVERVTAERIGWGRADIDRRQVGLLCTRCSERRALPAATATPAPRIILRRGLGLADRLGVFRHPLDMRVRPREGFLALGECRSTAYRLRDCSRLGRHRHAVRCTRRRRWRRHAILAAAATPPATTPATATLGLLGGSLGGLGPTALAARIPGPILLLDSLVRAGLFDAIFVLDDDVLRLLCLPPRCRQRRLWRVRRDRRRHVVPRHLRAHPVDAELRRHLGIVAHHRHAHRVA